ncbi:type II toxin-antitoxin system RelE/ParE family toxin [Candidatus Woesearchaeota archaeon]|nr:type II toxin-antitoxin system RelE/ParE family toxin [Candidatus Woesearchaeota archaeon]
MYELRFDRKAIDFLNKLERKDKERIWNKLQQCKENPFHFLEHLEDIEGFKLRVGDYRLIIDVDDSTKILIILKAGHRKNIYEN